MALFKILKGSSANLSSQKIREGYCYVTTDEGKMYIDVSDTKRICLNAGDSPHADKADAADKLTYKRLINGVEFDGSSDIYFYGTCSTAAGTAAKTVTLQSGSTFLLKTGATVIVKFTNKNSASSPTLNINGTGAKPIYRYGTTAASTSDGTSGWRAGSVHMFTYDGTGWIRHFWENTNTIPSGYCTTAADTAAKTASCTDYALKTNSYLQLIIKTANTSKTALTLNVNGKGAKPIYINGAASSTSNYTLPAGSYIAFYDGTNYYIRTDGKLPGTIEKADKANNLNNLSIGTNQRPVYFNGGVPTQTTYRMAGTNAAATTALSIASDLPTGIWYVNGTNTNGQKVSDFNQADGVVIANQYSDKWITEIYQDYRTGQLAVRGKNNGTWQAWRKVLDDTNYTSYTVKKDGTGASGTWGISISGNAATATNATNANYATTAGSAGSAGKLSESVSVGGATKPVYFSKGTPTACTTPASGAYFSSLPVIGSDGVMEIGRYIDFHYTSNSTNDYDVRIDSAGANKNTIYLPGVTGQVVVHTNDTKIGGSDTPVYIAATGAATAASKYAGGTQVTLNGTSKSASTASFYAPTGAGTAGYILKSNGSGKAPTWDTIGNLMNSTFVNVTGDTMTGNLEVTNTDNSVILNTGGTITHQVTATGGWARGSSWQHKNGDTITALGVAGLYGAGTTVSYYYIGNAYNDVWMKVTPGGHVTATKFIGDLQGAASRLSTSAGSTSQPVYFSGGVPVGITAVGAAYGGTGKTTLVDSANVLLNALSTGSSVPSDNDYFISQYVNGGTTTTTYHRRPVSKLYEYIKGKAEGTWGISISGNAATATHANTAGSAGSAGYADYLPTSMTFTPAESAITPDGVYDLIGTGGRIKRGTWSYANNGYVAKGSTATTQCPFGAIDLAGTTVIQAGNSKTQYTQIYITPPTASTTNAIKGEMLYYVNNGDGYSPTWYRVLTNNNYSSYTVKKDGTGATGTWGINISGNAASASKLSGTRTITLTGDVTGAGSSDGSTGWSIEATVKDDSHNHIISNVDGLQTALDNKVSQGASSLEMNSGGSLAKYGGFIDFHYHDANKKPTDASGAIVDKTPDYTSRIIEDAPGVLKVNGVAFQGGNITGTLKGTADKANNLGNYTIGGATQPVYFNGGVPTVVTAVGTAYGGTGNIAYTAGRVIYASAADKLSSSNLSMSGYEATMTATSTAGVRFKAANSNGGVSLLASTNRGMYDDTNSKWIVYTNTAGDQTYVINWKSKGSSDTPVYFNSSGAAVAASKYAGGTQVTLNNVSKSASTASFYAPTGAGTAGQVLKSSGSGKAPVWANISDLMDGRFVNASGDTMTGDLTLAGEKATIYKIERKKASGGGWAYAPMRVVGNDNAVFANIGVYGGDNALTYMYIGAGDYNSDINLRISATGAVTAKSFVGPLTGNATSATTATKDSGGNVIKDTYVKKAGDTMTGALNTSHQSNTWINSANGKSAINLTGTGYTGWISGNAKDGRLVISSYPNSTNLLYFGYMSNERIAAGTNNFEQSMTWDGSTNTLTATTFKGTLDGNAKTATNATNATNAGHATTAGSAGSATTATTANQLAQNTRMDYGWSGLNYFNISGTAGNAAKTNDTPTSAWWHILRFNHANSNGYYTDLAVPFNANSLYYKRIANGAVQNSGWVKVLDALNYNSYAPKLDGTGAKGTWGISITGNAATATNAGHATSAGSAGSAGKLTDINANDAASSTATWRRLWFCYNDNTTGRPAYDDRFAIQTSTGTLKAPIFSGDLSGNASSATLLKAGAALTSETADSALESTASLKINTANNTVYNTNDGLILTASWSASYGAQIWLDDGGGEGGMAIRNRNANGWNPWRQVITSANIGSQSVSHANTAGSAGSATSASKLTTDAGGTTTPVYFSGGKPAACTMVKSGDWFGGLTYIGGDGVMEVGKYIDFHSADAGTSDYDVRITAATTGLTISGTTSGTFKGSLDGNAKTATHATTAGSASSATTATSATYLTSQGANKANTRTQAAAQAVVAGGWATDDAGYGSTYGTTLDVSGYSTWYHRLAFHTNGQIDYWQGINTNTLTKIGRLLTSANYSSYALPLSGGTVTGTLILSKTTDTAADADNGPALIIGGTRTTSHIEIDCNEVIAKSNGTTETDLYLGTNSAKVHIGQSNIGGSTGPVYLKAGVVTACSGRTVPGIKSASAVGTLGWGTNNTYVADISLLAYWNGAYSSTSSNLQYCDRGRFGSIITHDASDYLRYYDSNSEMTTTETVNAPTYLHTVSTTGGTITTATKPSGMDNAWGVLHVHTHSGNYATQLGFGGTTGNLYMRNAYNSATFGSWRTILDSGNWTGIVDGRYVKKTGDSMSGTLRITPAYQGTASARYHSASLEIREAGGVGSAQSDIGYAPRIGFHWGNRAAASLCMNASGHFEFRGQDDASYRNITAQEFYSNGWFRNYGERGLYNETYGCHVMPFTGSYGGVRITGNSRGNYDGLIIGDSSGITLMSSTDRAHHGLYHQDNGQWAFYYNKGNKQVSILGAQTSATGFPLTIYGATYMDGRLVVKGNGNSYNEGIRVLPASNGWSNIFFSANTSTEGTMDGGWLVGRRGAAGGTYGAAGDFCIENNNSAGVNLTLTKSGVLCNIGPILGYRYKQGNAKPAFVWDKPGSHFTGVGANGSSNTIQFGPVDSSTFEWVSNFHQHWKFVGSVSADSVISTPAVTGGMWITGSHEGAFRVTSATNASAGGYYQAWFSGKTPNGAWGMGPLAGSNDLYFVYGTDANYNAGTNETKSVRFSSDGKVWGAVWNDYAEFRTCVTTFEAGQVVCENGDDTLSLSTERLQPGACIVSDTFGFAIGETDIADCPIAVSGRVLAYPYEDRNSYKAGDPVCAGPNGTVSKMTREEVREYPDRMIGTVSAIPKYETWGQENIPVNGRIWIKVV